MSEATLTDINGMTKRVYDKLGIHDLLPASSVYTDLIGFDGGTHAIGESYRIPVVLEPPNGFTYAGSSGGAVTLKAGRPMLVKQAEVVPFEMELREQVTYAALSRAHADGEGAFGRLAGTYMTQMKKSAANRLELQILRGQQPLGIVETVTDTGSQTADLTITTATWAPGIWWAVGKKATLDSFTSTTKNNGSGALITNGLNTAARKVNVTYTGTLADEIDAGDTLWFEGAWTGTTFNEMPGLITQASNLTGTSLGLSADTYQNWKGNTQDISGNMTFNALENMVSQLRDRGAEGEITAGFSNIVYSQLMNELKALRVFDSSYSPEKGKTGVKGMVAYSPQVGEIKLINSPFFTQSECLLLTTSDCARVGSADMTFGIPGVDASEQVFWERVPNTNAAEIQFYVDQCVCIKEPGHSFYGYGITLT